MARGKENWLTIVLFSKSSHHEMIGQRITNIKFFIKKGVGF